MIITHRIATPEETHGVEMFTANSPNDICTLTVGHETVWQGTAAQLQKMGNRITAADCERWRKSNGKAST